MMAGTVFWVSHQIRANWTRETSKSASAWLVQTAKNLAAQGGRREVGFAKGIPA
jgi:hypothetical protein